MSGIYLNTGFSHRGKSKLCSKVKLDNLTKSLFYLYKNKSDKKGENNNCYPVDLITQFYKLVYMNIYRTFIKTQKIHNVLIDHILHQRPE